MAGVEIGFGVLGILPLIISTAEHYNDCFRPFRRYRKFATEVDHFQQRFKIQRAIFRNQCRILLDIVTPQDATSSMLEDPGHPLWIDREVDQQLAEYLEESKDACVAVVKLINEILRGVERESQSLETIVEEDQDKSSIGNKAWRKMIGKKVKFSFSQSRLDEDLQTLKSLNDDFRTLSSQTRMNRSDVHSPQRPPRYIDKCIKRCQTVRMASQQIYEALGRACTKHSEHLAHVNLEVEHLDGLDGDKPQEVKFKLAFRHVGLVDLGQGDPVWFMVGSIDSDVMTSKDTTEPGQLGISLKRELQFESLSPKAPVKRVRFQAMAPPQIRPTMVPAPLSAPVMRRDLCDHLRKHICQSSSKAGVCIGMLELSERFKHLVYPMPSMPGNGDKQGTSLEGFLKTLSKNQTSGSFPRYVRLRLAKSLALAVLQFHATPWLKVAWRSQDILFFDSRNDTLTVTGPNLTAPHLNVKVIRSGGCIPHEMQTSHNPAPNPILFRLGVILLEIAYSATLRSLQQPCDLENGVETRYTEFFTARRLVSSIGREMGSSYGTIVKKLLKCDFGCGDDFSDHKLQAGYYKDVICELERLEDGFRQLQLG